MRSVLDTIASAYPVLRGAIRDHPTDIRRPLLRSIAWQQDNSLEPADAPLPDAVAVGLETFLVARAIAGVISASESLRCGHHVAGTKALDDSDCFLLIVAMHQIVSHPQIPTFCAPSFY